MEMLTDMDRLRLVAALGQSVLAAGEINPESLGLLLKLSAPNTRLWIQKAVADQGLLPKSGQNFATAK
jgi:hypothetical protein